MAAWSGWEGDVLKAARLPVTPDNERFLSTWHNYEESFCRNNPLNTTLRVSGSSTCNSAGVQSYRTVAMGAQATADTWLHGPYPALVAALATGDPFTYNNPQGVAQNVTTWGTPNFAAWYLKQAGAPVSHGPEPSPTPASPSGTTAIASAGAQAPHTHAGYADVKNSLSRHLPTQVTISQQIGQRTLRLLGQRHKVGR